jgi:hypothetical protein
MMTDSAKEQLVKDLKVKCQITWNNERDDVELRGIIDDAEIILNHKLGSELDYSEPGLFHNLFINYCWYARNGLENDFEDAYRRSLLMCRAYCEVDRAQQADDETVST